MKYKKIVLLTIFTLYGLSFGSPVFAHVLKVDGNIGAVLHIDPDDDPIANLPSNFYFEFKDKQNQFDITKCNCQVYISESGKQLYTQAISSPTFSYTFLKKDVYQLVVIGQPTSGYNFQQFSLSYDIRVARENLSSQATNYPSQTTNPFDWILSHWPHFLAGFLILGFIIVAVIREKILKKRG